MISLLFETIPDEDEVENAFIEALNLNTLIEDQETNSQTYSASDLSFNEVNSKQIYFFLQLLGDNKLDELLDSSYSLIY